MQQLHGGALGGSGLLSQQQGTQSRAADIHHFFQVQRQLFGALEGFQDRLLQLRAGIGVHAAVHLQGDGITILKFRNRHMYLTWPHTVRLPHFLASGPPN